MQNLVISICQRKEIIDEWILRHGHRHEFRSGALEEVLQELLSTHIVSKIRPRRRGHGELQKLRCITLCRGGECAVREVSLRCMVWLRRAGCRYPAGVGSVTIRSRFSHIAINLVWRFDRRGPGAEQAVLDAAIAHRLLLPASLSPCTAGEAAGSASSELGFRGPSSGGEVDGKDPLHRLKEKDARTRGWKTGTGATSRGADKVDVSHL